jgi:hypothetical protein
VIFLGDFSFVKIFLKNYCVTMTTTLNTSRSENTMVLSARVSACMYFLVIINILKLVTCRRYFGSCPNIFITGTFLIA